MVAVSFDGDQYIGAQRSRVGGEPVAKAIDGAIRQAEAVGWATIEIEFGEYRSYGTKPGVLVQVYRRDAGQPEKSFSIDLNDDAAKTVEMRPLTQLVDFKL